MYFPVESILQSSVLEDPCNLLVLLCSTLILISRNRVRMEDLFFYVSNAYDISSATIIVLLYEDVGPCVFIVKFSLESSRSVGCNIVFWCCRCYWAGNWLLIWLVLCIILLLNFKLILPMSVLLSCMISIWHVGGFCLIFESKVASLMRF